MATETSLNQIVKGAPPPDTKTPPVAPLPSLASASNETISQVTRSNRGKLSRSEHTPTPSIADSALSALPSSPPQIYLNLLILEASLRAQYLHLLSRRRLNTFFLLLLGIWNCFFIWALFLKPREDGQGIGGSVYWVVETAERLAFMGGVLTVVLVKATGQWERGIRWPRRWLGTTNRGLRGFNLRVVVVKGKWWKEIFGLLAFLLPFGLWTETEGSDWHLVEHDNGQIVEEDLANGGDNIMLLPLPKNFSSEFRENWEAYRTEYWGRENERRVALRKKMTQSRRNKAKEKGGWKWWTGLWRLAGIGSRSHRRGHDLEKHPHHSHSRNLHSASGFSEKEVLMAGGKSSRRRSLMRDGSHSRHSSRSSISGVYYPELDSSSNGLELKPVKERVRRGSSVSSTSSIRRNTKGSMSGNSRREGMLSPLTSSSTGDKGSSTKDKPAHRKDKDRDRERLRDGRRNKHEGMGHDNGGNISGSGNGDSRPTTPNSDTDTFTK